MSAAQVREPELSRSQGRLAVIDAAARLIQPPLSCLDVRACRCGPGGSHGSAGNHVGALRLLAERIPRLHLVHDIVEQAGRDYARPEDMAVALGALSKISKVV